MLGGGGQSARRARWRDRCPGPCGPSELPAPSASPARQPPTRDTAEWLQRNPFRLRRFTPRRPGPHHAPLPSAAAVLDELGLHDAGHRLVRSPAWPGLDGAAALEIMDSLRLEGVVAKAAHSPYQAGRRSRHWIKTPIRRSRRFVIGGFCVSRAGGEAVASLLVGGFDAVGDLIYCGRITSGLSDRARRTLYAELASTRRDRSPFRTSPDVTNDDGVRWVDPVIVARVEYREFTGLLRGSRSSRRGGAACAVTRGARWAAHVSVQYRSLRPCERHAPLPAPPL